MWLVYDLTGDSMYTGLAGFVTLVPSAFQFLTGPLVDRWPIRGILVSTQFFQGLLVALIPIAHYYGVLTVELVLIIMPLLSLLNQLAFPALQVSLPRLLPDEELVAANSAFSIAYQAVDMMANAFAGILVAIIGAVALFAIDAVTFAIALLFFATVYVPPASEDENSEASEDGADPSTDTAEDDPADTYFTQLRDGYTFIKGTFLLYLILGIGIVNFAFGINLAVLPAYADSLELSSMFEPLGSAGSYGILMAAFAAGNLFGAVLVNLVDDWKIGRVITIGTIVTGILWTAAILINWLPVTALLMLFAYIPVAAINVQLSATIQSAPPEEYVGRLSTIFGSASNVMLPIGSLVGGFVSSLFTPQYALAGFSVGIFVFTALVILQPTLRKLPAPDKVTM